MKAYFKIPLGFLVIGACLGILLRWHFVFPLAFLKFSNWLHAHSHVMFLGWVTNFLFLAFIYVWLKKQWTSVFRNIFLFMQAILIGLLISLPLQGYGFFTIGLLSSHIVIGYLFCFLFFRRTSSFSDTGISFIRNGLLFLILSSIGVFAIGPIAANGLAQSKWYYYAIFFYLHFQYNGFFVFGVLGLFFRDLEAKGIKLQKERIELFRRTLFYACFPTYFLSVIWSDGGVIILIITTISVLLQLFSLYILFTLLLPHWKVIRQKLSSSSGILLMVVLLSFTIKIFLQTLSAVPALTHFFSEVRFFVLAYLHLVLIGMVSFYLLAWLCESRIVRPFSVTHLWFLVGSFLLSELAMVATPLLGAWFRVFTIALLILSVFMALGLFMPLVGFNRLRGDRNQ